MLSALAILAAGFAFTAASAQDAPLTERPPEPPFTVPSDVSVRKTTIWSEGSRLAATIYAPKEAAGKLPTIITAYGWGGNAELLRPEGAAFAKAGYLVVMFDFRGWGGSEGRVMLADPVPAERSGNRFTAEVTELREVMDPLAEAADLANVIHWVQAEPSSDTNRIGLWGSSFGGGLATYVAGHDHRVKAIHTQVVPLELRQLDSAGYREGTKRARGQILYPKPGVVAVVGLRGAPITEHFLTYSPLQSIRMAPDCAIQLILAGKEQLFDIQPIIKDFNSLQNPKKNLIVMPDISHYDIYGKARAESLQLALAWFDKYLKL
jgi:pimeloyl-ACP methyl ester carboxylesterase